MSQWEGGGASQRLLCDLRQVGIQGVVEQAGASMSSSTRCKGGSRHTCSHAASLVTLSSAVT